MHGGTTSDAVFRTVSFVDTVVGDGVRYWWEAVAQGPGVPHAAPPSFNQQNHLRVWRAQRAHGRVGLRWHALELSVPGPVDNAAMCRALTGFVRRHETLRSQFVERGDVVSRRVFPADAVTVRPAEVPLDHPDDAKAWLRSIFDASANPWSWPAYAFAAIATAESTTLYVGFDQTNIDLYSVLVAARDLQEMYEAEVVGRSPRLPAVGSFLDACAMERSTWDGSADLRDAVAHWRPFVEATPRFPMDLGVASGPVALVQHESLLGAEALVARFEKWCRAQHADVMSGFLAAMAVAVRDLTGQRVYRTVVPVQTRVRVEWQWALGWFVNAAPITVPVGDHADFAATVRATHASVYAAVLHSAVPFGRVAEELAVQKDETRRDLYSWFSYVDMRRFDRAGAPPWRARGLANSTAVGDEVDFWVNRTAHGTYLVVRRPDTAAAATNLARLTDRFCAVIETIAGGVGVDG